jgi:hypothetical protein
MILLDDSVAEDVKRTAPMKLTRNHMEFACLVVYLSVIGFCFVFLFVLMLMPR